MKQKLGFIKRVDKVSITTRHRERLRIECTELSVECTQLKDESSFN